jgi:hypothetical protein
VDGHVETVEITDSGYTLEENPPEATPKSGKGEPAWYNTNLESDAHIGVGQYYDPRIYTDSLSNSDR